MEDYDPPWTAPEKVALDNLTKSESIKVDVSELEHFLLEPEDSDISITSFAENVRDEGASSCCSTHLEAREQVEALKWKQQWK